MSRASEEITKGLTSDILRDIIDYPSNQNIKVDGITWFKEDAIKERTTIGFLLFLKKQAKSRAWKIKALLILWLLRITPMSLLLLNAKQKPLTIVSIHTWMTIK